MWGGSANWTEPIEDPSRPFEGWWRDYCDPRPEIYPMGPLGVKARDAAANLLSETLDSHNVSDVAKRDIARVTTCLIIDAYMANRWFEENKS